jgi:isopentenyldiphosphate isomerase
MTIQQNDPAELLEVLDAEGHRQGIAKTRAEIHLDGDWHLAFHCWVLRRGGLEVVLQRRSFRKDTYPGCWDATAAGHWRFGETAAQAAREISEELGIDVPFEALTYRGRERASRSFPSGLVDREHHEVYVLVDDRPLMAYRPDPAEVIGLAAFRVYELYTVINGSMDMIYSVEAITVAEDGSVRPELVSADKIDLVPYSVARLRRMIRPWRARRYNSPGGP